MALDTELGLGPDDIVLDGDDPAPLPKKGVEPPPKFSAHVYCGQAAGWIKMALGVEVGLGPGHHYARWRPRPLSKKGRSLPIFGPRLLWPNACMDQDATWCGGRPRHKRHCFRWGPGSRFLKGAAPNFRPMSVVAKRLYGLRCHLVWR